MRSALVLAVLALALTLCLGRALVLLPEHGRRLDAALTGDVR